MAPKRKKVAPTPEEPMKTLARRLIAELDELFSFTPDDYRRGEVEGRIQSSKALLKLALDHEDALKRVLTHKHKPRGPADDPEPPLCTHDDPSWCDDRCNQMRDVFLAWAVRERKRRGIPEK